MREKAAIMKPWSKPIAPWKLQCETGTDPFTRQIAYDKLYGKRFDSKGIVQHLNFGVIGAVMIAFTIFFQFPIFCTFATEAQYIFIAIQKIVAFIITTILLVRMYKANVRFS